MGGVLFGKSFILEDLITFLSQGRTAVEAAKRFQWSRFQNPEIRRIWEWVKGNPSDPHTIGVLQYIILASDNHLLICDGLFLIYEISKNPDEQLRSLSGLSNELNQIQASLPSKMENGHDWENLQRRLAKYYRYLGIFSEKWKTKKESIEAYQQALLINKRLGQDRAVTIINQSIGRLQSELTNLEKTILPDLEQQKEKLEAYVKSLNNELSSLETKLLNTRAESNDEKKSARLAIQKLNQEVQILNDKKESLENIDSAEKRCMEATRQYQDTHIRTTQTEDNKKRLDMDLAEVEKTLLDRRQQLTTANQDLIAKRQEIDRISLTMPTLAEKEHSLQNELNLLEERLSKKNLEIAQSQHEQAAIMDALTKSKAKDAGLSSKISLHEKTLSTLGQTIVDREQVLAKLQNELKGKNQALTELSQKEEGLSGNLGKLEDSIQEMAAGYLDIERSRLLTVLVRGKIQPDLQQEWITWNDLTKKGEEYQAIALEIDHERKIQGQLERALQNLQNDIEECEKKKNGLIANLKEVEKSIKVENENLAELKKDIPELASKRSNYQKKLKERELELNQADHLLAEKQSELQKNASLANITSEQFLANLVTIQRLENEKQDLLQQAHNFNVKIKALEEKNKQTPGKSATGNQVPEFLQDAFPK